MTRIASAGLELAVFLTGFPVALPAQAHFMWLAADDQVNLWLARQHSLEGSCCCSSADAYIYDGAYSINADGSVTLALEGGAEIRIDAGKRVKPQLDEFGHQTDPNPTGGAVWWHGPDGNTYCWADGPLT